MALPGFTAETSLGPTVQIYRVLAHPVVAGLGHLFPQQYDGDADLEGAELEDVESAEDEMGMDVAGVDEDEGELEEAVQDEL
jgi:hypothetical protein